jgi:transposase
VEVPCCHACSSRLSSLVFVHAQILPHNSNSNALWGLCVKVVFRFCATTSAVLLSLLQHYLSSTCEWTDNIFFLSQHISISSSINQISLSVNWARRACRVLVCSARLGADLWSLALNFEHTVHIYLGPSIFLKENKVWGLRTKNGSTPIIKLRNPFFLSLLRHVDDI